MKKVLVIAAFAAGLLAGSIPGALLAAGESMAGMADPSNAAPERMGDDSMQAPAPIETGALTGEPGGMSMAGETASGDEIAPTVETGGVKYRVGLDTGP